MTYSTVQGDYFDWISYQVFGTERYANVIMRDNHTYSDVVAFDAGIVLNIPIIPAPNKNISNVPWGVLGLK